MKKVFLSLALLAISTATVLADNNTSTPCNDECTTKTECVRGKKDCKKVAKECKNTEKACLKADRACLKAEKACLKADRDCRAFEGLNLTEEQKTKLQGAPHESPPAEAGRGKKRGKGKLSDEQKKQMRAERKIKMEEANKKYLEGVKSILTPEQYTKFLENKAIQKNHGRKTAMHHKGKKGHKLSPRFEKAKKLDAKKVESMKATDKSPKA